MSFDEGELVSLRLYELQPAFFNGKRKLPGAEVQRVLAEDLFAPAFQGGCVTDMEGRPLRYGKPGFLNPDFVAAGVSPKT